MDWKHQMVNRCCFSLNLKVLEVISKSTPTVELEALNWRPLARCSNSTLADSSVKKRTTAEKEEHRVLQERLEAMEAKVVKGGTNLLDQEQRLVEEARIREEKMRKMETYAEEQRRRIKELEDLDTLAKWAEESFGPIPALSRSFICWRIPSISPEARAYFSARRQQGRQTGHQQGRQQGRQHGRQREKNGKLEGVWGVCDWCKKRNFVA